MFPQLNFRIGDEAKRASFERKARTIEVNGSPLGVRVASDSFFSLDFGQENASEFVVKVDRNEQVPAEFGINNVIIQDKVGTTAYNIPQGSIQIYYGKVPVATGQSQISISDICPTILQNYGVTPRPCLNRPVALFA